MVELVKRCLHNDPRERPSTKAVLTKLQGMRLEIEGRLGMGTIKLDLDRLRLAKEMQEKDRKIKEKDRVIEEKDKVIEEKDRRIKEKERVIEELTQQQVL